MAHILIGARPLAAHVMQTFRFARDLQRRGHRVTYVLGDNHLRPLVESQGFPFYHLVLLNKPLADQDPSFLAKYLPVIERLQRIRNEAREVYKALIDGSTLHSMLEALTPDLIVTDSTAIKYALPFLAWNIPLVMVSPTLPNEWDDNVPHTHSHYTPTRSPFNKFRCRLEWVRFRAIRHAVMRLGFSDYSDCRRVAEHYGLRYSQLVDRPPLAIRMRQPQLILCPSAFDFPRLRQEKNIFVDSGICADTLDATPQADCAWVSRLDSTRPIVFCSFGTRLPEYGLFTKTIENLLTQIIEAFSGQSRFQLFVRVPSHFNMSAVDPLPKNILLVNNWISQIHVLRHAAIHITHGGFTSVRESIECEVPMIVVPFDADQPGNAARVAYHNLGARITPGKFARTNIVDVVAGVHDSAMYKKGMRHMKEQFDRQREMQSAADVIESLLPSSISKHVIRV